MQNFVNNITANEYDNAVILPSVFAGRLGGVCDAGGNFIVESAYKYGDLNLWGGVYETDENIEYVDETVIYAGMFQKHWGNFLFDDLNRLWYLLQTDSSIKVVFCGFDVHIGEIRNTEFNYLDALSLLGITKERILEADRPVRYKKVIIPDMSMFPGTYYSDKMLNTYRRMAENALDRVKTQITEFPEKIYLTRTGMPVKKEIGEKAIERIFKKNGFAILSPEKMSQTQLIAFIRECKCMAAIEGTITHNAVFAKPGTEIYLLRKLDYENTRQKLFDEAARVQARYVDVYSKPYKSFPINHDTGPYLIGVNGKLKRFMRDNGYKISFADSFLAMILRIFSFIEYSIKCIYYKLVLKY